MSTTHLPALCEWPVCSPSVFASLFVVIYLILAELLRWRRYIKVHAKFGDKFRQGKLSVEDAQEIMHLSALWDMPGIFKNSLAFATVKTYTIPHITKLLWSTRQISDEANVSRRYADTGILTFTVATCPVSGRPQSGPYPTSLDPRSMIALSRINWLHKKYPIRNEDMLYTISLYILENISWTRRYGWRRLSMMEEEALFIFWSEIGRRMNIVNIPSSLEKLRIWSKNYEAQVQRRSTANRRLVDFAYNSGALAYPDFPGLRKLYRGILVSFLDENCRKAMMQPKQPWYVHALAAGILYSRKYHNRFLAFPRLGPSSPVQVEIPVVERDADLRMHPTTFEFLPWYKPEGSGWTRLMDDMNSWLGFQAAMPGPDLKSGGYRLEEVGPPKWEHAGHDQVFKEAESRLGCPIGAPWKSTSQGE